MKVLVIGGGVSGLSAAARLLEAGFEAELWTRDGLENTTSNVAAALWYPYRAGPEELTRAWGLESYTVFKELAADPATGVRMCRGVELVARDLGPPGWRSSLDEYRPARPDELPEGYDGGHLVEVPVIEMPIYLVWLAGRVRALGGLILEREAASMGEALAEAPAVVNCAGLGARELVADDSMFPIRGQVVRVSRGRVDRFLLDRNHPQGVAYIVPRSGDCVLGGTVEEGVESTLADPAQAQAILARCAALDPRLEGSRVLGTTVGLRPGRASVRLELEHAGPDGAQAVVHDYGHGGAGVTLSWGCAAEVVRLLQAWVGERSGPGGGSPGSA